MYRSTGWPAQAKVQHVQRSTGGNYFVCSFLTCHNVFFKGLPLLFSMSDSSRPRSDKAKYFTKGGVQEQEPVKSLQVIQPINFELDKETTMNTMKGFYASISSGFQLKGSYLEALSEITSLSYRQAQALQSDLTWQNSSQQNSET